MVKVDFGIMLRAVSQNPDDPEEEQTPPYLNRTTGEIVFLYDSEETLTEDQADGVRDLIRDRINIETSPKKWLEIPRYDSRFKGNGNQEAFIRKFLKDNGIDAELVF